MNYDTLGDRMKAYEALSTTRFLPYVPVIVRLDGNNFSRFTKNLRKPYDAGLAGLMHEATRILVKQSGAVVGYTQSDEISLVLVAEDHRSQIWFDGKPHKLVSISASVATWIFGRFLEKYVPTKAAEGRNPSLDRISPIFDSRAFVVPNLDEAANYLLWREQDATRNAIVSATLSFYSSAEILKKNCAQMQEMLYAKGVNFNDYPDWFKRGAYFRRGTVEGQDESRVGYMPLDKLSGYEHQDRCRLLFGNVTAISEVMPTGRVE